jgi:hypothetical protein
VFDVLPYPFVGVKFRGIGRKEEEVEPALSRGHVFLDKFRGVDLSIRRRSGTPAWGQSCTSFLQNSMNRGGLYGVRSA